MKQGREIHKDISDVETANAFCGRERQESDRTDRSPMLPFLFFRLFNSLFPFLYDPYRPAIRSAPVAAPRLTFQLRHLHATSEHGHVLFSDVDDAARRGNLTTYASEEYTLDTRITQTHRPPSFDAVNDARYQSMKFGKSAILDWDEDEIVGPDVESREALLVLAKMTSNAYLQPDDKGWYPLGENWTTVRLLLSFPPSTIQSMHT